MDSGNKRSKRRAMTSDGGGTDNKDSSLGTFKGFLKKFRHHKNQK